MQKKEGLITMHDLATIQRMNAEAVAAAQGKHADLENMLEEWEYELLAINARDRYSARHWNGFIV